MNLNPQSAVAESATPDTRIGIAADASGSWRMVSATQSRELQIAANAVPEILGSSVSRMSVSAPTDANDTVETNDVLRVDWQSDAFHGQTAIQRLNATTYEFRCRLEFSAAFQVDSICWPITAQLNSANVLDNRYRWRSCATAHMVDAWTPFAVRGRAANHHVQLIGVDRLPAHEVVLRGGTLTWSAWLDHQATHPRFTFVGPLERNWHNQYSYEAGDIIEFTFRVMLTDQPASVLVAGRFPGRRRGLICITDHADHDTCERFAALMFGSSHPDEYRQPGVVEGFAGLRLPFTKSVFSQTNDEDGAGLHNPRFVELCDHAHECGIELGPHGVHKTRDPDPSEYAALMKPFEKYGALTWIDHGRSFQCNYGRSGWDPNHTHNLHQMLDQLGLRFMWGRLDFGQAVPNKVLDQLQINQFSGWNYLRDLPRSAYRAVASRRPWAFVHELATLLFQLIPDRAIGQYFRMQGSIQSVLWRGKVSGIVPAIREAIRLAVQILTPQNLKQIGRQAIAAREELRFAPTCFREHSSMRREPLRWLFNTVAVHDVEDAFDAESVSRLLEDYGTHLSHTYLASVSRAHLSHALERHPLDRNHWRLTPKFAANLRHMAHEKAAGRLWFASFGEVGTFWEQLATISVVPEEPGVWTIRRSPKEPTLVQTSLQEVDLPLVVASPAAEQPTQLRLEDQSLTLEHLNQDAAITNVQFREQEAALTARL